MTSKRARSGRARLRLPLWYVAAFIVSAIFLVPLGSMIVGSLRQPGLPPPRVIEWLPNPISLGNYVRVFQVIDLGRYILNTLVVEGLAVPVTLVVSSWAGFALSQLRNRLSQSIMAVTFLLLFLPETALWVSRFILYRWVGVIDTPFALAAPSIFGTTPIYMLIFYWTFRRVPDEIWEASHLDGAGALRAWWTLGVPAGRAAFAAVGVLTFFYYWREFTEPLLYIQTAQRYTLAVGLAYLEQLDPTNWPILLAGSVIVTAPLIVVFLVAQPFFLEPIERTGAPVTLSVAE
ncbi:MAG TPA: carbohydrate ABC transporter permease [Chloroflexia bacterium]|nr:carbohydrate ABC transporter permease [Chloroflexia bacterium]